MKNKNTVLSIIFLLIMSFVNNTQGHSGRTDSSGGHYNRTTGSYHYHSRGLDNHTDRTFFYIIIGIILIPILIFLLDKIKDAKQRKRNEQERKERFDKEKQIYKELYDNKNISEFVKVPDGTIIKEDGLPYDGDISEFCKFGNLYTRYHSSGSKVYHVKFGCSGVTKQVNTHIIKKFRLRPCSRCALYDTYMDTSFVDEYNKLILISKTYGINIITSEPIVHNNSDE
jgi:uncharacterized membrane protein